MSTRRITNTSALVLGILAAALAVGCGAARDEQDESPEAGEIASAGAGERRACRGRRGADVREQEFAVHRCDRPQTPVTDELEATPPVMESNQKPDAAKIEVALMWGRIPGNLANQTPYNWSGKISISRGAMLVRRTIRFEDKGDQLLPRKNPQEVAFTSVHPAPQRRPAPDRARSQSALERAAGADLREQTRHSYQAPIGQMWRPRERAGRRGRQPLRRRSRWQSRWTFASSACWAASGCASRRGMA